MYQSIISQLRAFCKNKILTSSPIFFLCGVFGSCMGLAKGFALVEKYAVAEREVKHIPFE